MDLNGITPPPPVSIEVVRARRAARASGGVNDGSAAPTAGFPPSSDGDTVSVSGAARRLAWAGAAVAAAPEERAPLVDHIRAELLSGAYDDLDVRDMARTLIDLGLV